jgi:hypothetical protein
VSRASGLPARDDDLLAGERSIEQQRKLRLCFGYVDLRGHGFERRNVLDLPRVCLMVNRVGQNS